MKKTFCDICGKDVHVRGQECQILIRQTYDNVTFCNCEVCEPCAKEVKKTVEELHKSLVQV